MKISQTRSTHLGSHPLRGSAFCTVRPYALAFLGSALALLAGCRVGPKYTSPIASSKATAPAAYKEGAPDMYANLPPGTWRPANPQDATIKGKWWEIFNEPELNTLEEQLDINNQNLAAYFQNFLASRALIGQYRAQLFPTLSVAPQYQRTKSAGALRGFGTSSAGGVGSTGGTGTGGTGTGTGTGGSSSTTTSNGGTFTDLTLPFDVSWQPDLFGRIRSQISEYQFAAQVSAADLQNERLLEQAALAEYYFQLRGQDALQDLYNKTIQADRQALELTRALVETGIDSPEATAQAEVTLREAEEGGAGIASNRAIYEHAIATLIGKPASQFSLPVRILTTAVPAIPVGLPSDLLERRPDIAAAERTLAEANALIGVEKALYYPNIALTGRGGLEASSITSLFSVPALFWSAGGTASETIFDAGLRKSTVAQYTAQYNADLATYRQTVLTAFQQVEDYISTVRVTSDQIARESLAVDASQRYLNIATERYRTGLDPFLNVLTAQTTLLNNQQTQVTLRVSQMTAAVELIQALGGGWNAAQLPAAKSITGAAAERQVSNTP